MTTKYNKFKTVYFLIPVYNEALNVETLSNGLINTLKDKDKFFLFVDDCSEDETVENINRCFSKTSYEIIKKEKNTGPGHSFNMGFEWILENSKNESDIIVTIEADNTSDTTILPNMIAISELGYDLVLASVYAQGGGFEKTSFTRKIVSFLANMLFRTFFDVKVLTLSSFYRVYKISLIRKIQDNYQAIISERGFISMLEILLKAIRMNAEIIEVPMVLKSGQRKGKSKMKIINTTLSYLNFLLFRRESYRANKKP